MNFKKIASFALAAAMTLSLAACGGGDDKPDASKSNNTPASTSGSQTGDASSLPEITAGSCATPAILTSIGQSADVEIVGTLCSKAGIEVEIDATVSADDLTADCKTLLLSVGGSSKGLGAAGIDADGELARVDELIKGAEDAGLSIIVMHTGGSARRGDLSDKFITPIFEKADYAIVVKSGDEDGLMAGVCASNSIPVDMIDAISEVATVLPKAFK